MARYYDLDKLLGLIEAKADTMLEGKCAMLYVAKWLNLLPAADVVAVPCRCGECKFYETYYHMCNRTGDYVKMNCDDFCSYGERKDDNDV